MNARTVLLLLLLPLQAAAQGYAGLGTAADGYRAVTPPAAIAFPRDHGAHPGFRVEWWYLTANLTGADGAEYGAQWTLFRIALAPEDGPDAEADGWANPVIWMGHAAVTSAERHAFAETFARGGIGQAGVALGPFRAWIDDWEIVGAGADALADITVTADGDGFGYRLRAVADGPPVRQGDDGYSRKSAGGQASYYYSQPFYRVEGSLRLDGREQAVSGVAWLDREWSSQPLGPDQEGWDWFALHLDGGEKVMAFRLRGAEGAELAGTWIAADGRPEPLAADALTITPLREAGVAGRRIPVTWRVEIPAHGFAVETEPLNPDAWLATTFPYWEGPIRLSGTHPGRGYLEMTGYE